MQTAQLVDGATVDGQFSNSEVVGMGGKQQQHVDEKLLTVFVNQRPSVVQTYSTYTHTDRDRYRHE